MRRIWLAAAMLVPWLFPTPVHPATQLTLKEAEQIALSNHPRISQAFLTALASNQVVAQIEAAWKPVVALAGTAVEAGDPNNRVAAGGLNNPIIFSRAAAGILYSQLLDDSGRTSRLEASARFRSASAQDKVEATREQVLVAVDVAYFDALAARAVLRVAEKTVAARKLDQDRVQTLSKSRLVSGIDVSFAAVQVGQAELLLSKAKNQMDAASAKLAEAMGVPSSTSYAAIPRNRAQPVGPPSPSETRQEFELADEPLPAAPAPAPATLIAAALSHRPDLTGLRLEYQGDLQFAKAEHDLKNPTISALGAAGVAPAGDERKLNDSYGAIGLNVSVPVFNGHLFDSRAREAKLKAKAKADQVRDLENQITREVQVAWLNKKTAYERLPLTEALLAHAKEALDLAQERYRMGLGSAVEVSQAELNETSAEIDRERARYEFQMESAILAERAGLLRPPPAQLNGPTQR